VRELQRQVAFGVAAACIGLVAAMIAIGFLAFALFLALASALAPEWAAVLTAASVMFAALLMIVVLRLAARPRRAPDGPREAAAPPGDIAMELGSLLGREAHGFVDKHKGATVLGSLAIGFVIGLSPGLRDLLRRGL
jgi:hypothetical protein